MLITITSAVKEDFECILAMREQVHITVSDLLRLEDFYQCLVAKNKSGLCIGFTLFSFGLSLTKGKYIYVNELFVTENYRNKGAGKLLFERLKLSAKRAGCRFICWQTSCFDLRSIGFYLAMGAQINDTDLNCMLKI